MTIFQTVILPERSHIKMPERNCEISEIAEELLNMMKNEKKVRFRDRLRMLRLLKSGEAETMTRAAELCGVSRLTAAERFHRYSTGGIRELLRLKTVPGRKRHISGGAEEALIKRPAGPEGFCSCDEIRIRLKENYNIDIPSYRSQLIYSFNRDLVLQSDFPSDFAESNFRSFCQRNILPRFHIFDRAVPQRDHPFLIGEISESPYIRVFGMLIHSGNRF